MVAGKIASAATLDGYAATIDGLSGGPPLAHGDQRRREYATALGHDRQRRARLPGKSSNSAINFAGAPVGNGASRRRAHAAGVQFVVLVHFNALPAADVRWYLVGKEGATGINDPGGQGAPEPSTIARKGLLTSSTAIHRTP